MLLRTALQTHALFMLHAVSAAAFFITLNVITLVRTNHQIPSTHQSYYPPRFLPTKGFTHQSSYPPKSLPTTVCTFPYPRKVSGIPHILFTICSKEQKVRRMPTNSWMTHQRYYPPRSLPTSKSHSLQSYYVQGTLAIL